ncbi:GNAT family N-acetyltransferase, partial [Peribacillus sp. NPDC060253]
MKKIREATDKDMEVVYMMGYDVWGDNMLSQEYVTMCQGSSKYKKGKWYVLEETDTKELLSSLIVYELNLSEDLLVRGIGSIATPLHLRQKGYASILIEEVINKLEKNID